jgi:hypothetical protein
VHRGAQRKAEDEDEGFGEVGEGGVGGAEVIGWREEDLQAALAGGDADGVVEFDGFVGEGREGLARGEDGDAAANVAGEGFDLLQGGEVEFLVAGDGGEFFEVEFGVAGEDGEEVIGFAGGDDGFGEEGFEDLFDREADFFGDGWGGEVVGVDLVGAELVRDFKSVELAAGVGFGGLHE